METNEIIKNEEVVETTEEIVEAGSGKGLKVAASIGLAVLVGGLLYKFVINPMVARHKVGKDLERDAVDADGNYSDKEIEEFDIVNET